MKKSASLFVFVALMVALTLFYSSCKKDKDEETSNGNLTTGLTLKVMNKNSNPISGVKVTVYNQEGTTSADGKLTLTEISLPASDKDRMIMKLTKTGYFDASVGLKPNLGKQTYYEAVLTESELSGTINNATGGTIANNSGTIFMNFPPNSLAYPDGTPFTGEARIYTAYYTPDDANFALTMPGGADLAAVNTSGASGSMISFGALSVEAKTPDMKLLQLTGMKSSNVLVNSQIANSMLGEAPATIPIWRLNPDNAVWEEIGSGVKKGNRYEYSVDHFSAINKDVFIPRADFSGALTRITGKVCDDLLKPYPFARVDVWQRTVFADDQGLFEVMLPSNRVYTFNTKYCTKAAGPFTVGQQNFVDLCCGGGQPQGYFDIEVDGLFIGTQINNELFTFTDFGYFFVDTIINGYKVNDVLYILGGNVDQYWEVILSFGYSDLSAVYSTFSGTGNYPVGLQGNYKVIAMILYCPTLNQNEGYMYLGSSGNVSITGFTQGGKMEGSFTCNVIGASNFKAPDNTGVIKGKFEIYEMQLKNSVNRKMPDIELNKFRKTLLR